MREGLRFAWHAVRYAVAGCVSTLVAGGLPALVAGSPAIMAVWWVLMWAAAAVVSRVSGQPSPLQLEAPWEIVLIPAMLLGTGGVGLVLVLAMAAAFTLLVVLPAPPCEALCDYGEG